MVKVCLYTAPMLTRLTSRSTLFLIILILPVSLFGQDFIIQGQCQVEQEGTIYIYLVDEEQFKTPHTGLEYHKIDVRLENEESIRVDFSFSQPAGEYGLLCFLDTNNNGHLDSGLFGPTEPWAMSNLSKRRSIPHFRGYLF
jgi:uncharacterized protein (DUF2141 family)